jgi:UDP-3-O-[3-hydroxymyristoyl] glucosamine N-acyltransferase
VPRLAGIVVSPAVSLAAWAERHGGAIDGDAPVDRVAPLDGTAARSGDLRPFTSRRHLELALRAAAEGAALLVDAELAPLIPAGRRWVHPHAAWALAGVLAELAPSGDEDRHETAIVERGAELGARVAIGAGALVMSGAIVGDDAVIGPHAVVYPRVRIGARVVVGAGAVLGRPGFGFATGPGGEVRRVPQLGGVWIEDDVEIGALATVDAGTLSPTVLERGVRLDAHVHVGHNTVIRAGTFVAAQTGFAGSVRVGAGVRIGGQAGIADHVIVGDGAQIAAKAGVIGDIPAGSVVAGYPAVSRVRWLRGMARMLGRRGK